MHFLAAYQSDSSLKIQPTDNAGQMVRKARTDRMLSGSDRSSGDLGSL